MYRTHHFMPSNGSSFSKADTIYYLEIDGYKYVYTMILRPYVGCEPRKLTPQIWKELEQRIRDIIDKTNHDKLILCKCLPHIIGVEDDKGHLANMVRQMVEQKWFNVAKMNLITRIKAWKKYRDAKKTVDIIMNQSLSLAEERFYKKRFD